MTVPLNAEHLVDRLWSYCHVLRHDGVSTIDQDRHRSVLDRRNCIAHEADLDPQTGERRPMDGRQAAGAVHWIDQPGHALHSLLVR